MQKLIRLDHEEDSIIMILDKEDVGAKSTYL